jgi:radical SAM protein with 4Fe4S-binding SPASM domain
MLIVNDLLTLARDRQTIGEITSKNATRFAEKRRRPPVVVWNICHHCNMTCPHCYASAGPKKSLNELSTAQAFDVIDKMAQIKVPVLVISGGEPLLREDVFELITRARQAGIVVTLSSNGTLITQDIAQKLADHEVTYVGVSIDGLPEFNDAYRGLEHGFERALAGLRHCNAVGIRTGLRMTVTRRNHAYLPQMLELCRSEKIRRFYLSHLVYAGRAKKLIREDLNQDECRGNLDWFFRETLRELERGPGESVQMVTGGNDSDGPYLLDFVNREFGREAAQRVLAALLIRGGNSAGEGMINIDHRGEVRPDQFWIEGSLGNITQSTLADIMEHPLLEDLRNRANLLQGHCANCQHLAICRGSHRERALAAHGYLWAHDPACVLLPHERQAPTI